MNSTPWPRSSLAEQMMYHYEKHQAAYFKKLNALVEGKPEANMPLRRVIEQSTGPVFNNAAQAWNTRSSGTACRPAAADSPAASCCRPSSATSAASTPSRRSSPRRRPALFGSGWAWLAADRLGKLEIMPLGNADTPLKHGREPVFTLDVWEHAYYIDYRNERPRFVDGFWARQLGVCRQVVCRAAAEITWLRNAALLFFSPSLPRIVAHAIITPSETRRGSGISSGLSKGE